MLRSKRAFPFWEVIGKAANPWRFWEAYLYRLHLTPFKWWKWKRYYLHTFFRPDEERGALHDHPWGFRTWTLFGGYDEMSHRMVEWSEGEGAGTPEEIRYFTSWQKPSGDFKHDHVSMWSTRYRPAEHAHQIMRLHMPIVITLVERDNTRRREWGFWVPQPVTDVEDGATYHWQSHVEFAKTNQFVRVKKEDERY